MDFDVVVAGAGPVGLFLAGELRLGGASVLVLEREEEPGKPHKQGSMGARSLNAPGMDALARRGLKQAVKAASLVWFEFDHTSAPEFVGHFAGIPIRSALLDENDADLSRPGDGGVIAIQDLETVLTEHAESLGVQIQRGHPLTQFTIDDDGVAVNGTIRTGWLVGCDGGRSTVRKLGGFDFPGTDAENVGRQAIVDIADPEKLSGRDWAGNAAGSYVIGGWQEGPSPRIHVVERGPAPTERGPVTLEELQESLRRVSGTDVTLTRVHVATRYTDATRQTTTYRRGRVLLAGDAAHVHSPAGGQGLNLGLGDAMNLGWKLAAVATGHATEDLLDTYTAERHPLGAWVQGWSNAQSALNRADDRTAALKAVVSDLVNTSAGATYVLKHLAGLAQHYDLPGEHPLLGRTAPDFALTDGTAVSDHSRDGHALLVDFSGELDDPDALRVTLLAARPQSGLSAVLIRPDGYICWVADHTPTPTEVETAIQRL